MKLVTQSLSQKLHDLVNAWKVEFMINFEHDMNDSTAWNNLIEYLMELEEGSNDSVSIVPVPDSGSDL